MKSNQDGFSSVAIILLIVFILALMGFFGWRAWNAQTDTNDSIDSAEQHTQTEVNNEAQELAEFTSAEYGYSFSYPAGWYIESGTADASDVAIMPTQKGGLPSIVVYVNPEWETRCSDAYDELREIIVGGKNALQVEYNHQTYAVNTCVKYDGDDYEINLYYHDLEPGKFIGKQAYQIVLESFEFDR